MHLRQTLALLLTGPVEPAEPVEQLPPGSQCKLTDLADELWVASKGGIVKNLLRILTNSF